MKKIKFKLTLAMLLATLVAVAQDNANFQPANPVKRLAIGVEAGSTLGFLNNGRKELNQKIADFESLANGDFTGGLKPRVSWFFEAFVDHPVWRDMSLRAGIRLGGLGYKLDVLTELKDREYQLDYHYKYAEKYSLRSLEFPVTATYRLGNRHEFNAGFLLGFAFKKSAKMAISIGQDVYVNGQLSKEDSDETVEAVYDLPDSTRDPFWGIHAGAAYQVYPNLYLTGSVRLVQNYALLVDYGHLSDFILALGIRYRLSGLIGRKAE